MPNTEEGIFCDKFLQTNQIEFCIVSDIVTFSVENYS